MRHSGQHERDGALWDVADAKARDFGLDSLGTSERALKKQPLGAIRIPAPGRQFTVGLVEARSPQAGLLLSLHALADCLPAIFLYGQSTAHGGELRLP